MLRLIQFLFSGCFHKWETIGQADVIDARRGGISHVRFYLKCERCGNIKIKG
jgi:hypothetical protein